MTVTLGHYGPARFFFFSHFMGVPFPPAPIFMGTIPIANPEPGLDTLYKLSFPGAEEDGSKVFAIQAGGSSQDPYLNSQVLASEMAQQRAVHQAWPAEVDSQDFHCGRRELTSPNCPLPYTLHLGTYLPPRTHINK